MPRRSRTRPHPRDEGCWFPRVAWSILPGRIVRWVRITASCAPTAPVARLIRSGRDPRCPWKVSGARYRKTHLLGLGGHELGRSLDRLGDDSATDGDLAGGLTGAADGLRVADGRHGEGSGHGGHAHEEVFSGAGVNTERSASTRRASQRVRARGSSVPLFTPIRKISQDGDLSFCRLIAHWRVSLGACCPIEDLTSTRPLIGRRMPSHGLTIQVYKSPKHRRSQHGFELATRRPQRA